jgi:hypothetical protein
LRAKAADWERREAEDDCQVHRRDPAVGWRRLRDNCKAIGLYDIAPTESIDSANERWLKRRAREYCLQGRVTLTADPD